MTSVAEMPEMVEVVGGEESLSARVGSVLFGCAGSATGVTSLAHFT